MTRKQGSLCDSTFLTVSFNTERFDSVYSDFNTIWKNIDKRKRQIKKNHNDSVYIQSISEQIRKLWHKKNKIEMVYKMELQSPCQNHSEKWKK